jgi:LAS superfamily LD-carboxypeptidase LdcB
MIKYIVSAVSLAVLISASYFGANAGTMPENGQIMQCVIYNCPVFAGPNVKSKKIFSIKLEDKIKVSAFIKSKDNRHFDFLAFKRKGRTYYTPFEFFAGYIKNHKNTNLPYDIKVNRRNNISFSYKPTDLKKIPQNLISPKQRKYQYYLRVKALIAFTGLISKARADGVNIYIASAYRSPYTQIYLYLANIKINGPKQTGSAKPTHSEHHLGTTCDFTSSEVNYALTQDFFKTKAYKWLKINVKKFNMRITYSKNTHKTEGYMWEPWHIRWMGSN